MKFGPDGGLFASVARTVLQVKNDPKNYPAPARRRPNQIAQGNVTLR